MKRLKKFYFFIIITFFLSEACIADNKIAYIDLDLILLNSFPSKSLFTQLKKIEEKAFKELKLKETKLTETENKILSTKNIISKEEYNKKVKIFKSEVETYQKLKNKTVQDLKKKRKQEIILFLKKINPLIEQVMEKNSIEILIEKKNVFIAKSNYDITNNIIEIINKNIVDFKISD